MFFLSHFASYIQIHVFVVFGYLFFFSFDNYHELSFDCFCIFVMLQQLKLVMDSIIWAFRHTERNIAETGLNLLLEMLKNFQV